MTTPTTPSLADATTPDLRRAADDLADYAMICADGGGTLGTLRQLARDVRAALKAPASPAPPGSLAEALRFVLSRLPTDEQLDMIDDDERSGLHRWADAHLRFDEIHALRRALAAEEERQRRLRELLDEIAAGLAAGGEFQLGPKGRHHDLPERIARLRAEMETGR